MLQDGQAHLIVSLLSHVLLSGRRHLSAPEPGKALSLSVNVTHPELGAYFQASLTATRSTAPHVPNEVAGLATLWRWAFGCFLLFFFFVFDLASWEGKRLVRLKA